MLSRAAVATFLLSSIPVFAQDALSALADDFWRWRAATQPYSGDDIPRIERPGDGTSEWSPGAIVSRREKLAGFEKRWRGLSPAGWPVARQVDYRLLGSALARVRWELDIERGYLRNPGFYVDQTVASLFEALTPPPPFSEARSRAILARLDRIPATLDEGKQNLTAGKSMRRPFALLAIQSLDDISGRMDRAFHELAPLLDASVRDRVRPAAERAGTALQKYAAWLQDQLPSMDDGTAVGRDAYVYFLRNVALMPFTPEQLLDIGRDEWARSVAFETYQQNRNRALPQLTLFRDQPAQMAREEQREAEVRRFLEENNILSVPAWMQHYRNLPLPGYLKELGAGVDDDLTGPSRLNEGAVSYIRPPSPSLGYFALSTARDPRPILVHEGVPGHYFQLALSWHQDDPIRRHYYDSGANEGIGFYAEEMMLQAGFFDDSPRTREIIYNFMRLRALRVEVDVKLALGLFTIDDAADYLQRTVPMDARTARGEAAMFASTPGQAISYQVGKNQILRMLARARGKQGSDFDLKRFHDFVWTNGNVPISLQQWELFEDPSDVPPLDLTARPPASRPARQSQRRGSRQAGPAPTAAPASAATTSRFR
jgi:uncharacterized protein (DUF885 family)